MQEEEHNSGLEFSKDGVSPEEQPGFQLQEGELRKEASSCFSKDALTVPGCKCQWPYIPVAIPRLSFRGSPHLAMLPLPGSGCIAKWLLWETPGWTIVQPGPRGLARPFCRPFLLIVDKTY